MRPGQAHAAAFVALLALGDCHGGAASLQGHWRGVRAEGVTPEVQAADDALAATLTLDFVGDMVTVMTPKERRSGQYSVVKEDEATVLLATGGPGGSGRETFIVVDTKTIKWAVGSGKLLVLQK
jgi:hypothetical protein